MKKLAALMVQIFVISFSGLALADETLDYSGMSLDELVILRNTINEEIASRIGSGDMIYTGDFLVGTDIKAGKYIITCTAETPQSSDDMVMGIFNEKDSHDQFAGESAYNAFRDNVDAFYALQLDETAIITLEEGQYFVIKWGEATCSPYAPSWSAN